MEERFNGMKNYRVRSYVYPDIQNLLKDILGKELKIKTLVELEARIAKILKKM